MSELKVEIEGGKTFLLDKLTSKQATIDEKEVSFDMISVKEGKFHLLKDRRSFNAELIDADYTTKNFTIKVNNNLYTLKVEDRFDLLLHQLGMDQLASAGVSEVKAPMPGLVLKVEVEAGQEVKKDEPLIVLEAMKMENVLKSPVDATVKSIEVKQGQAVEKNQVLIEFES
jgi:biotin carboxyl carrier protein